VFTPLYTVCRHCVPGSPYMAGGNPELTQAIDAAFIREGHFARQIQRMRKLYASVGKRRPSAWRVC
jgi:DNA-binding transcriptional MocR family regulator